MTPLESPLIAESVVLERLKEEKMRLWAEILDKAARHSNGVGIIKAMKGAQQ